MSAETAVTTLRVICPHCGTTNRVLRERRLGIRSIPTLAIFTDGKEIARTAGAMDATRFLAWLRPHV